MNFFICPECKNDLKEENNMFWCKNCNKKYVYHDGIFDFLTEKRSIDDIRIEYFDKIAPIYENTLVYPILYRIFGGVFVPSVKKEVKIITNMLGLNYGNILDIACGTGLFARNVAKKVNKVYGLDFSKEMLKEANTNFKKESINNFTLVRSKAEKLPFKNDFFEGALCCGVLDILPDINQVFMEINRVLKKEGKIVSMTFVKNKILDKSGIYNFLQNKYNMKVLSVEEIKNYLHETGFKEFNHKIYGFVIFFEAKKGEEKNLL